MLDPESEECDDGNGDPGDLCTPMCQIEVATFMYTRKSRGSSFYGDAPDGVTMPGVQMGDGVVVITPLAN